MKTANPTVRLPRKEGQPTSVHPEVERISGLVPPDIDAESLYHEHMASKQKQT